MARLSSMHKNATHNMSKTKAYNAWNTMIMRCHNKNSFSYKYYGARGIAVCEKWRSFDGFFSDMGPPPVGMSLERIDNNSGYSEGNVIWANRKTQGNNTRRNVRFAAFGESKTIAQWSEDIRCVCPYANLYYRIVMAGWEPEMALSSKSYQVKHKPRGKS